MEHTRLHLPDVQVLLAHRQKHRNIRLRDDVSLAELRALELAGDDARQIVAEHMADGVFRFNQFHGISSRTVIRSPFCTRPGVTTSQKMPSVGMTHFPVAFLMAQSL